MIPLPRTILAVVLPLVAGVAPAGATATLVCKAEDRNVSLELIGNIGSGDGAAVQAIEGSIKIKPVRGKFDAMEFKVEPGQVAGSWTFGNELRIGLAPEEVREVSIFLAIIAEKTRGGDDMTRWRGHYVLKARNPNGESELKGRLRGCEAS